MRRAVVPATVLVGSGALLLFGIVADAGWVGSLAGQVAGTMLDPLMVVLMILGAILLLRTPLLICMATVAVVYTVILFGMNRDFWADVGSSPPVFVTLAFSFWAAGIWLSIWLLSMLTFQRLRDGR